MSAPTLVQYNDGFESSDQLSFLSNVTAGNFLLCAYSATGSASLGAPTDSLNNSWIRLPDVVIGPDLVLAYCPITYGGPCTVTSGSGDNLIAIAEFSPSTIVDFTQITQGSATSSQIAGAANQLLVGYATGTSSSAITGAGSGFTFEQVNSSSRMAMEYQALSGAGNVNSDFTGTAADITTGALILATPTTPSAGTPYLVQSSNRATTSFGQVFITFPNSVQAGDFLIVMVTLDTIAVPSPQISDSLNNKWTVLTSVTTGSANAYATEVVWYCENSNGGSNTIDVSGIVSGSVISAVQAAEFSPSGIVSSM